MSHTILIIAAQPPSDAAAPQQHAQPQPATCSTPPASTCSPCSDPGPAPANACSPAELLMLLNGASPLRLIDVRSPAEYRGGHVKGAQLLPLDTLELQSLAQISGQGPVLILCKSGGRAAIAAKKLQTAGLPCRVVSGGTDACLAAGLPIVKDSQSAVISLERQVRIAAGGLALSGTLLGHFVHPGFYGLSGFVGAGLIFAGITDFCGMGLLLARMPWNR